MKDDDLHDLLKIAPQVRKDAEAILFELEERPEGTCTSTALLAAEVLSHSEGKDSYLLDLDRALNLLAYTHGLLLDKSHHDDLLEGLPYCLDFYVWHRENAAENGKFAIDPEVAKLNYYGRYDEPVAATIADLLARALPERCIPTELDFATYMVLNSNPTDDHIHVGVESDFSIGDAEFELGLRLDLGDGSVRRVYNPPLKPRVERASLTCTYPSEEPDLQYACWDDERGVWNKMGAVPRVVC